MEMLLKNPPHILVSSNYSNGDSEESHMKKYRELKAKGCYLISGAGNNGRDGVLEMVKNDVFKAVGCCRYKDGVLTKSTNSSEGTELDWVCIDNLYANWDNKKHKGTSFGGPVNGAMLGLVQCFFWTEYGEVLDEASLTRFVLDNCVDLEGLGFDTRTGHGLFRLPEATTLNPYRYIKKYKGCDKWRDAIEYLVKTKEMDTPQEWINRIVKSYDVNQMWFVSKWANAVAGREKIIYD